MAEMTVNLADKESGSFSFAQGSTIYEVKDKKMIVRVENEGHTKTYHYVKKEDQK